MRSVALSLYGDQGKRPAGRDAARTDYDIPAYIRRGIRIAELDPIAPRVRRLTRHLHPCSGLAQQQSADAKTDACEKQPDEP